MTEYRREGKHTIRVGDTVQVAGADIDLDGFGFRDPGWTGARVVRLQAGTKYPVLAEVTHPRRAATRTIDARRLTRTRQKGN